MSVTISITPTRFIASAGKLDSNKRYIHKNTNPDFYFVIGPDMDCNGGGLRYVYADGTIIEDSTYNGTFSSVNSVGVKGL